MKRITEDNDGNPVHGVASNYLCDLEKGDEVKVTGPFGTTFLMPNHAGANLLMICTGTGSAPMRAMTERRRRKWARGAREAGGSMTLFFGARTAGELPYFGPLKKLPQEFIDVQMAFSRESGDKKEYVQDRLRAQGRQVASLLQDENTFLYICGHRRMEDGVNEALTDICAYNDMDWSGIRERMRLAGRYHVETYY